MPLSGFYKNGKPQGEWISYDSNGYKTAMATYDNDQNRKMVFGAIHFMK
jgi:antitoxin component YwqK of YwqJK toxin-antitoxin module